MRILYVCADPGIPIRGHKGSAVHVRAMVDAFAGLGHQVTLVTPRAGPEDGPAPHARLVEVPTRALAAVPEPKARERYALAAAGAVRGAARALLRREPFDLIYERYSLWSDAGARLAGASGTPLVVEVNAPLRVEAARYRTLYHVTEAAAIEARLLGTARAVAVVSQPLREHVLELGIPAERVHVLPNAVDEQSFHPGLDHAAARAALGLAGQFVVGFVGTARPWHDLDTLIEAFARLRSALFAQDPLARDRPPGEGGMPARLLLVGEFPPSVREAVERRGLTDAVTLVGPVPHDEVPRYLAAMHVAVSPHPALEGFYFSPLKLFEYLACGVASVAADVPPVAGVVTDGVTGLLYPPGDAGALAERLAALAGDRSLRGRLAWQGAAHVLRHHTWRGNARSVLGWLSRLPGDEAQDVGTTPIYDETLRRRLYRATRPDVAGPLLAAHVALPLAREDGAATTVARLEVLHYKPRRRCVIAYDLGGPASMVKVVGKVFRDERGAGLLAVQRALWSDGFGLGASDGITVAEPLAYIPQMRMLVQERVPGQTLDGFLGAPDFDARVRLCAAAIAKLHAGQVRPEATYPLAAELDNLARFAADLSAWRPEHREVFERRHARLQRQAAALAPAELEPAHRDFYYGQVLFDGPRVALIDLDLFALADPALDVANFAAHLRFLALQRLGDPGALDAAARAFVEEYVHAREDSPGGRAALGGEREFRARLAFYEAATDFRLMHVALQRPHLAHCYEPLLTMFD